MNVGDLIKKLEQLDKDLPVQVEPVMARADVRDAKQTLVLSPRGAPFVVHVVMLKAW